MRETNKSLGGFLTAYFELGKIIKNLKFENYSPNFKRNLSRRGLRNADPSRNLAETIKVFETIPAQVRAQGEAAVRNFLSDKDWSHKIPHSKGGGNQASNGVFENFRTNRSRGAKKMTPEEVSAARSVLSQAAFRASVVQIASAMAKGAAVAAGVELIFAILENSLLYADGQITQSELINRIQKQTIEAAVAGGLVTGVLVAVCLIFPPVATLLESVAIVFAAAGVASIVVRAWDIACLANKVFGFTKQAQMFLSETNEVLVQFILSLIYDVDATEVWLHTNINDKSYFNA